MKLISRTLTVFAAMAFSLSAFAASHYQETIGLFKNAGQSAAFFDKSYAYAVFPTIGEGAVGIGGAHGKGHVYVHGVWVGDVVMSQITVGFQLGGKAFSQIIFFEDKRALDEFESGHFQFGADASAVAVTAAAEAGAGTNGVSSEASAESSNANTSGSYVNGMAVFTIAKGGLMYAATISGQQFSYIPRGGNR
jgi:lipid-binding SYLF domain-containing protein